MLDNQGNAVRWKSTRHSANQIVHACRRASERYGFEMTVEDYECLRSRMIAQFRDQTGIVFLWRQTKARAHFAIWHGCEWLPIVYDRVNKTIVTFLPKQALIDHRHKLPW